MFTRLILATLLSAPSVFAQEKILNLDDWYLREDLQTGHHRPNPNVPATVPGVLHLDLMRNNLSPDFYTGLTEQDTLTKWLESRNWVYETTFTLKNCDLNFDNADLVFEGLDTYADVFLNDSLVISADNMFRCWELPVKELLKDGINKLKVAFISPLNKHMADVLYAKYELPSGNENTDLNVSAYTRKAAYHFGWDWGPRLVTMGIWRPCYLRFWNDFRITDFYAQTLDISKQNASMLFQFTLESDSTYTKPFRVEMLGMEFEILVKEGTQNISFYHHIENAKLWYPNGQGDQHIYKTNLFLLDDEFNRVYSTVVNFAVRKIELVNEKDSIGTSFYFKVNDKPVFMKGANYIPQDLFLPRVTDQQTESLLQLVKESNMNMLRVWGGGIYESDFFYQQCDEKGILVWQDFMFANSMYPATEKFHNNVIAEIDYNVKRLRNHPCIAMWCGNNEIEVAWHNWGWQKQFGYSATDSTEIWNNYKTIFHQLIPDTLKKLDPSRAYIPSSPQSNWGKPENFNHGAMHYWGVWHGKEPIKNFDNNVGRFMVEYGFQSYPIYDYLLKTISAVQMNRDSSAFKNRQKSYIGDGLINAEIVNYFGELEIMDWLWATQYVQAQALKRAIVAHRFKAPHCMGTLFWQLNDCWPGASWSVLDYYQNQKLSYLEVSRWFSPTIAVFENRNDSLILTATSDIPFNGEALIGITNDLEGMVIKTEKVNFSLNPFETKQIWSIPLKKWKKKYNLNISVNVSLKNYEEPQNIFEEFFRFRKLSIDEIY